MSKVEWRVLDLLDHYNFTLDSPQREDLPTIEWDEMSERCFLWRFTEQIRSLLSICGNDSSMLRSILPISSIWRSYRSYFTSNPKGSVDTLYFQQDLISDPY